MSFHKNKLFKKISRLLGPILWSLSQVYKTGMAIRRWAYQSGYLRSYDLGPKVISVGNIDSGGTGKSPVIIKLALELLNEGHLPLILARGYKSGLSFSESVYILNGSVHPLILKKDKKLYADEARMQSNALPQVPVVLGADRVLAFKKYSELGKAPSHVLLDDGFQHLRIKRDLNIVTLDSQMELEEVNIIPMGTFREGLSSLVAADLLLFTRSQSKHPTSKTLNYFSKFDCTLGKAKFIQDDPYCPSNTNELFDKSRKWYLLTGIAKPNGLVQYLARTGVQVSGKTLLADHEVISKNLILRIEKKSEGIITTEKDYYRDIEVFKNGVKPIWVMPISIELDPENLFIQWIKKKEVESMVNTLSTMMPLGTKAPEFCLLDTEGKLIDFAKISGKKAYLVMFICNHCPFVIHIASELKKLSDEYLEQNVAIFAINSNDAQKYTDDSPEKMKIEKSNRGYNFPYLYDESQDIAKTYQAACTPDFFLFDQEKLLKYRGQLDRSRPSNEFPVDGKDLRIALDSLLQGREPPAEQKPSIGCNIKWKPGNEPQYFTK